MKKILFLVIVSCFCHGMWAQSVNAAYQAYIEQYRDIAIEQQRKYDIPASITLAQALLESAAGTSELATKANNHFGIKTTSDWQGKSYKHGKSSFRKYNRVADSYEDHSLFLKRKHYASLFELSINDYKGWARGLRKCGYATDPKYPEKLIRIIELYELNKLPANKKHGKTGEDSKKKTLTEENTAKSEPAETETAQTKPTEIKSVSAEPVEAEQVEEYILPPMEELQLFLNHRSGRQNGVRFIIAGPNETFASLALFLNMYERTLRKYNDALESREIKEGDIVYIYPKKNKAQRRYPTYYFKEGDDAWEIAQKYGIKLKSLYQLNGIPYGTPLTTHQRLDLR